MQERQPQVSAERTSEVAARDRRLIVLGNAIDGFLMRSTEVNAIRNTHTKELERLTCIIALACT